MPTPLLHPRHQLRRLHAQRPGQAEDRRGAGVAFAALQEADIVAVQARALGQGLLAEAQRLAMTADFAPQGEEIVFVGHAGPLPWSALRSTYCQCVFSQP